MVGGEIWRDDGFNMFQLAKWQCVAILHAIFDQPSTVGLFANQTQLLYNSHVQSSKLEGGAVAWCQTSDILGVLHSSPLATLGQFPTPTLQETGGYDDHMIAWGGENIDQSLRSWLCGGPIEVAEGAFVAHMWRDPNNPKTRLKHHGREGRKGCLREDTGGLVKFSL